MSIYLRFPREIDYGYRLPAAQRAAADSAPLSGFKPYVDTIEHAPGYVEMWDQSVNVAGGVYAIDVVAGSLYEFRVGSQYAPYLRIHDADGFEIKAASGKETIGYDMTGAGFLAETTGRIYVNAISREVLGLTTATLTVKVDHDAHGGAGNDTVTLGPSAAMMRGYLGGDGNDTIRSTLAYGSTLNGGGGNDMITIGPNMDTVNGGAGIDTLEVTGYADTSSLYATGEGTWGATHDIKDWTSFDFFGNYAFYGIEYIKIGTKTTGIADLKGYVGFTTDTINDDNLRGDNGANDIVADLGNDQLNGFKGNDKLSAGRGNDFLFGGQGDDVLLGGEGQDTALYEGKSSDFKIVVGRNDFSVTDKQGDAGADLLNSVERLEFADRAINLDYTRLAQSLYFSYFGRAADSGGLANFASQLEALKAPASANELTAAYAGNAGVRGLVDSFGASDESKAMYGGDTAAFVKAIYNNVLGRNPDQGGLAFWSRAIDSGELTRPNASLAIMAGAQANTSAEGQLDAALVANRVSVATNFTFALETASKSGMYASSAAANLVKTMLASVTASTDVMAFQAKVDAAVAAMAALPVKAGEPVPDMGGMAHAPLMLVGLPPADSGV